VPASSDVRARYHPHIAAVDFGPNIDNPWFPLVPGTTFTYVGTKDGKAARDGKLTDREESFRAGVDGALPGVYMQAHPERDRRFRQEWYRGHAEDQFRVVGASATVTVPYGHFEGALRTEESTRLEPGVLDDKL
jgi:hypothetical protein